MKAEDEEMMFQAMQAIEAQELLASIQVASFPHMTKSGQEKLHRAIHKSAFPSVYEKSVTLDAEQLSRLLNG